MTNKYYSIEDTIRFGITVSNPSGGALTDADAIPVWSIFEDNSDTPLLQDNFIKRVGFDGSYKGFFDASGVTGFESGKFYEIHASGAVDSVEGRAIIDSFELDDLYSSNLAAVSGDLTAANNVSQMFGATWSPSTDTLEAIRDKLTDVETDTQDLQTQIGTAGDGLTALPTGSGIADAVWDETRATHESVGTFGQFVNANIVSISGDITAAHKMLFMYNGIGYSGGIEHLNVNTATSDNIDFTATQIVTINNEVLDVLATDLFTELTSVPTSSGTLVEKINFLFALARNRGTQTVTTKTIRNDDNDGDIGSSTISDDGTTFIRGEWS